MFAPRLSRIGEGVLLLAVALVFWGLLHFSILSRYAAFADLGQPALPALPLSPAEADPGRTLPAGILGHDAFFWSEAAFHYRTTLIHAVPGYQDPAVLSRDRWQEYPEGVDQMRQYSLLMEPVLGRAYRLLAPSSLSLIEFLQVVLPALHVLLFWPLYFVARGLGAPRGWSFLGLAVFATSSLAFSPLLSSFYVKETFSWVLFALFILGHFRSAGEGGRGWLVLAAGALWLFLGSWHLAQFLTLPVLLAAILADGETGPPGRPAWLRPLVYLGVFLAASAFPWLRARQAFLSLPTLLSALWLGLSLVAARHPSLVRRPRRRLGLLGAGLLLVGALYLLNAPFRESYSHVSGLFWQRLSHGFEKPANPGDLPFAVRVFWVPPFTSPRWAALKAGLGWNLWPLLGAFLWAASSWWRRGAERRDRSLILTAAFFLLAFLLVERLAPPFLFLGSILVAVAGARCSVGWPAGRWAWAALLLIPLLNLGTGSGGMAQLLVAGLQGEVRPLTRFDREWPAARAQLFGWIRTRTPGPGSDLPGSAARFVGEIGMGPQLLLYCGRPVALNSQFENRKIRDRYQRYLEALTTVEEEALRDFFLATDATHLFLSRDWATAAGRNSPRYLAGRQGPVRLDWILSRLHFQPTTLRFFEPVHENAHYRVFAFRPEGARPAPGVWGAVTSRWWNPANFRAAEGVLLDPAADRAAQRNLDNLFRRLVVPADLLAWQQEKLRALFDRATGEGTLTLARWDALEARIAERLAGRHPATGRPLQAEILQWLDGDTAFPGILPAILPHECSPREYGQVADLLLVVGEYGSAAEFYGKAGAMYPRPIRTDEAGGYRPTEYQERMWESTILCLVAADQQERARALARFCADRVRPGSPRQAFFRAAALLGEVH